jgi:hypothetical protein
MAIIHARTSFMPTLMKDFRFQFSLSFRPTGNVCPRVSKFNIGGAFRRRTMPAANPEARVPRDVAQGPLSGLAAL